jgi:hypothetical protein
MIYNGAMKRFLLLLLFIGWGFLVGCQPTAVEPAVTPATTPVSTTMSPLTPTAAASPTSPPDTEVVEATPDSLPIYLTALDPIPDTAEHARTWATAHNWPDLTIADSDAERIRLTGADGTELTFLNTVYQREIIYSTLASPASAGPTATPGGANGVLAQETAVAAALAFVRAHDLVPEPLHAWERPTQDGEYIVQVVYAPAGIPLAGIEPLAGVTVRMDGRGVILQARILPLSAVPTDPAPITPLVEVYGAFTAGTLAPQMFTERIQLGEGGPADPRRFLTGLMPVGEAGDMAVLVYAAVPTQPEYLLPHWLIARPVGESWRHYAELYLPATGALAAPAPIPTPTPLAQTGMVYETVQIVPPLRIDEMDGMIFTNAAVDGITRTVQLDAESGTLQAVFGLTGGLALDAARDLLAVDKHPHGLTVIDTTSGAVVNEIEVPPGERSAPPPPLADTETGNFLLFRDNMLLIADPLSESWQQTVPFTLEMSVCGETAADPPPISQAWLDGPGRLLYLSFVDYVCTPWVNQTILVYDLAQMAEVARYPGLSYVSGVGANGRFYAKSWNRLGILTQWAWEGGRPWLPEMNRGDDFVAGSSGFHADLVRGLLYENEPGRLASVGHGDDVRPANCSAACRWGAGGV